MKYNLCLFKLKKKTFNLKPNVLHLATGGFGEGAVKTSEAAKKYQQNSKVRPKPRNSDYNIETTFL